MATKEAIPQFAYNTPFLPPAWNSIPPELKAYWDTEQYTGQPTFKGFRRDSSGSLVCGLAEYSNFFFVTDDTMFGMDDIIAFLKSPRLSVTMDRYNSPAPIHQFPFPQLAYTNFNAGFSGNWSFTRAGEKWTTLPYDSPAHGVDLAFGGEVIPNLFTAQSSGDPSFRRGRIGFTDDNREAHARKLLPKAISYSAGVLNYFFRGKLEICIMDNGSALPDLPGNLLELNTLVITNKSGEPMSTDSSDIGWSLYWDDIFGDAPGLKGSRSMAEASFAPGVFGIPEWDGNWSGTLAPGASFQAKFLSIKGNPMDYTLVFAGTMGHEKHTAIAAKRFTY